MDDNVASWLCTVDIPSLKDKLRLDQPVLNQILKILQQYRFLVVCEDFKFSRKISFLTIPNTTLALTYKMA